MKDKFIALDYLRGMAAIFVVLLHARWSGSFQELMFIQNSYLFVDLFFILSGFVIYHSYSGRLTGCADFFSFVKARVARLYPLHLLVLFFFLIFESLKWYLQTYYSMSSNNLAFVGRNSFDGLLENLMLIQAIGLFPTSSWNGPSWSISAEFWTYILFAFCVLSSRVIFKRQVFFLIVSFFFYVITYNVEGSLSYEGVFRCIAGFSLGVYCYKVRGLFFKYKNTEFLLSFTVLIIVFLLSVKPVKSQFDFILPFLFSILILLTSKIDRLGSETILDRFLNTLGQLSYTMYMIHAAIIFLFSNILKRILGFESDGFSIDLVSVSNSIFVSFIYLFFVVLISYIVNRKFEIPMNKKIKSIKI